jgi:hypothetical protein
MPPDYYDAIEGLMSNGQRAASIVRAPLSTSVPVVRELEARAQHKGPATASLAQGHCLLSTLYSLVSPARTAGIVSSIASATDGTSS